MKLFLDCEFTQLNSDAKLISLALIAESGEEFYVELSGTYTESDCSDFVVATVLPQLNAQRHAVPFASAQAQLWQFLQDFDSLVEVCSDAPDWDWEFFCEMAYQSGKWPPNVINHPTNLIELFNAQGSEAHSDIVIPDLPHHALLDARLLAALYAQAFR